MTVEQLHQRLRANGDIFLAASLAGSLLWHSWTLTVLGVYLFAIMATAPVSFVPNSFRIYFLRSRTSAGLYYNYRILAAGLLSLLVLIHWDRIAVVETSFKSLLVAFVTVVHVDRFRWKVLVYGATLASISAFLLAIWHINLNIEGRLSGDLSPISFGMLVITFSAVSAVGFVSINDDRLLKLLTVIGLFGGLTAALLSGSRSAIIALPLICLLLVPSLWRQSRRTLMYAGLAMVGFLGIALAADAGRITTRMESAFSSVTSLIHGKAGNADHSVDERSKLQRIALELFARSPLVGVGELGWSAAIEQDRTQPDGVLMPYNQAHNQYTDDLAKGGILRFLVNLILLVLPLFLFARYRPFSGRPGSHFALAGTIVSSCFIVFCLSEALLMLSLLSMSQTLLTCYLLSGCDADPTTATAGRLPERVTGARPIPA